MKTAQQLIGNESGSIGLIGTIAVGYCPPAAKLLPGNCAYMSVENDHHVAVPVISLWSPCTDIGLLQVGALAAIVVFTVVCSHFQFSYLAGTHTSHLLVISKLDIWE